MQLLLKIDLKFLIILNLRAFNLDLFDLRQYGSTTISKKKIKNPLKLKMLGLLTNMVFTYLIMPTYPLKIDFICDQLKKIARPIFY